MQLKCLCENCKFVQVDNNSWKLKRHIWDHHLRKTNLYSSKITKTESTPSFEKLTKEEKSILNPEIIKHIEKFDPDVPKTKKKQKI
eukprot:gene2746-4154_t